MMIPLYFRVKCFCLLFWLNIFSSEPVAYPRKTGNSSYRFCPVIFAGKEYQALARHRSKLELRRLQVLHQIASPCHQLDACRDLVNSEADDMPKMANLFKYTYTICKTHHIILQIQLMLILVSFFKVTLLICVFLIFIRFFVAFLCKSSCFLAPF